MKAKSAKGLFILAVTAAAFAVAGCGSIAAGAVLGYTPNTITVQGYGEARGIPDMASINLGVNIDNADIAKAVQESNEKIADLTAALLGLGIEPPDIQTTGFNVFADYRYDPVTGQSTGERFFSVDSTLQVNVRNVDEVGKVLETALENGANNIYGLSFGIQDTDALTAEARAAAVDDARERAEQMAEKLGVTSAT